MAQQSDWAAAMAAGIGVRVARCRRERGLTAAKLADAMTQAGAPMTRQILANLEGGRRPTVSLAEMLALSYVLGVPLVALIVDPGAATVEILPEVETSPLDAVRWVTGERDLTDDGIHPTPYEIAAAPFGLLRLHEDAVREARQALQAYWLDRADEGKSEARRKALLRLRDVRGSMRAAGVQPPVLDPSIGAALNEDTVSRFTPPPSDGDS